MNISKITLTSLVLSFVAGYADTATFIGANGLFSAHVTGNFVVFAYDVITHQTMSSWVKLISFPVFILAIIFSTLLVNHSASFKNRINKLLIIEAALLIITGVLAIFYKNENPFCFLNILIPMLVVFALGLQNAYGRFFAKELHAPTTMMTGNVTQLFIDVTHYITYDALQKQELKIRIINQSYVVLPFFAGCICGGTITKFIGLSSVIFIGILMLVLFKE
jgi:uncharacterized membrane protein YoaK (UPF0700 family)